MNAALWRKAVRDAWPQLLISCLLLFLFGWLFVWLMSLFTSGFWTSLVDYLPGFVQSLMGIPLADLARPVGRISILYTHIVTLLVCIVWAVGRGSDPIAGEIDRGTMDLVLTMPVRRVAVVVSQGVVATLGAAILVGSLWLGNLVGLGTVTFEEPVAAGRFLSGAVNLLAMTMCLTGLTAALSAGQRDRWRTIWLAGGFFAVASIVKMVARLWADGAWLKYLSFLTAYEPQQLILMPGEAARSLAWRYDSLLLALGLAGYALAAVIFARRDIPGAR
jgi:ABC-2 type transport system permease protein